MRKELYRALVLTALLVACVAIGLLLSPDFEFGTITWSVMPLPAQAAPPPVPLSDFAAGASEAMSGSITGNVASDLTFTEAKGRGIVSNRTGGIAYVSLNRATGVLTTSTTVFDYVLDDKEDMIWDIDGGSINVIVESLTVYVSPTSGFRAVGWR